MPASGSETAAPARNGRAAAGPMNLMVARILWGALLSTHFIYLVVLATVRGNGSAPQQAPAQTMVLTMAAMAVGNAVMSFVVPRLVYARAVAANPPETREAVMGEAVGGTPGFRTAAPSQRVFSDAAAARRQAVQLFQAPFIVGMAMAESVSLFGFVLGFLGAEWAQVLPFFALGIVAQAVRFPTVATVEGMFEQASRARFPG